MLEIWCPKYGHIDNNSFCINVQLRKTLLFEKAQLYNVVNRCPELLVSLHFDGLNFSNSVQIRSEPRLNINSLNLSNTYMNVVGRKILYEDYRVSYLCMSYNDMTFLNPSAISNIISLRHLDLSFNSLQIMNVENNYLFANLLLHFRSLTFINLRRNSLSGLPEYFFRNNNDLETIILSENQLSTVTFEIKHLREICLLDLRGNCIMTLDSSSMQHFDNLFQVQINENIKIKIFVNTVENNLTCSSCSDKVFVDWLQTEKEFVWNRTHTKCLSDNGSAVNCFHKSFTDMCTGTTNRKFHWLYWILCIVGLTGFSASVALSVRCLKRCKEKSRQVEPREKAVLDLTNLSKGSEYLVFLAFSSKDETFVNKNVVSPLQQCLQERVGMEKNVLCIGDRQFRVGRYIHDEIITCLQKCKVVVVLIKDNYCRSNYCTLEFQKACQLNKPVIFMTKDSVSEELMTPMMRLHYHSNTRIIWAMENGQYVRKGTWNGVCDSILDLVAIRAVKTV